MKNRLLKYTYGWELPFGKNSAGWSYRTASKLPRHTASACCAVVDFLCATPFSRSFRDFFVPTSSSKIAFIYGAILLE